MGRPKKEPMVEAVLVEANNPYDTLCEALGEAYAQAAEGKGAERHTYHSFQECNIDSDQDSS